MSTKNQTANQTAPEVTPQVTPKATTETAPQSMLCKGLIRYGNTDTDNGENRFIWARVITNNPVDEHGNKVQRPGSIMIYGVKGKKEGDLEKALLLRRDIGGLYDYIDPSNQKEVLEALDTTLATVPTITVAESTVEIKDRSEANLAAKLGRIERKLEQKEMQKAFLLKSAELSSNVEADSLI
ncbi:MAG: hypothetical protein RLZZ499_2115 [Cyanobacteriota bacterium]|jgi:hypothetical protein